MHIYYDAAQLGQLFKHTNIVPPLRDAWRLPTFVEPREFWSNQPIGQLFSELADRTPAQYTSPYISMARNKLGEALVECAVYYGAHGDRGFVGFARAVLEAKADDVRAVMGRNPFQ